MVSRKEFDDLGRRVDRLAKFLDPNTIPSEKARIIKEYRNESRNNKNK